MAPSDFSSRRSALIEYTQISTDLLIEKGDRYPGTH